MISNNFAENFPSFEASKDRKTKKNIHNPAESNSNMTSAAVSVKSSESAKSGNLCKTILCGGVCTYGNRCKNAHYEDEWCIKDCHHGERCNRVKGKKCKNVDPQNMCLYIHPHEDLEMFYARLKVDKAKITRPSEEEINKRKHFSKMCNSFFLGVPCNKPIGECTYAHSKEQLSVDACNFREKCKHITRNEDGYKTKEAFVCIYRHPSETFNNYRSRVLEPCRKMNAEKKETKQQVVPEVAVSIPEVAEVEAVVTEVVEKSWGDIMEEEDNNQDSVVPEEPNENDKIVIEVSESMAVEMLKMMMANGKTNFELKIRK
jgi:hypothetical protein